MKTTLYTAPEIVLENGIMKNGGVLVEGEEIRAVLRPEEVRAYDGETIDGRWKRVLPGFIDLHLQGTAGYDIWSADPAEILNLARALPRFGVTSFLATTEYRPKVVEAIVEAVESGSVTDGARIAGIHLEGPFINPDKRGAIAEDVIQSPDRSLLDEIVDRCRGRLRMMTLAPEMPGAMELIPELANRGVVPAVGHSDASFQEIVEANRRGLRHACHLFNAMGPLNHREPGTVGGCLAVDSISVQVIPDGIHVHPEVLKLVLRVKPQSEVAIVTDAVRAAGLGDGNYDMMGEPIKVRDGKVTDSRGRLAGSALTMIDGFRNVMRFAGIDPARAADLASTNPARVLGDERRGKIGPGLKADMVFLDENMDVVRVLVSGREVYP